MPEYLAPGVFVEETSFRSKSIEGVPTSTTGVAGATRYGPVRWGAVGDHPLATEPRLVTSFTEYERVFGGLEPMRFAAGEEPCWTAHFARAFFANGGRRLYVQRVYRVGGASGVAQAPVPYKTSAWRARWPGSLGDAFVETRAVRSGNVAFVHPDEPTDPLDKHLWGPQARRARAGSLVEVRAQGAAVPAPNAPLQAAALRLVDEDADGRQSFLGGAAPGPTDTLHLVELQTVVSTGGTRVDVYDGLGVHPRHRRYAGRVLELQEPEDPDAVVWLDVDDDITTTPTDAITLAVALQRGVRLTGGLDGAKPEPGDLEGLEADLDDARIKATGLAALGEVDDIAIVALPDGGTYADDESKCAAAAQALIGHAERLRYRIAVVDPPPRQSMNQIRAFRGQFDSKYAALYHPWIEILDPLDPAARLTLPPSGFVAGVYARTDVERGVFKAPANEVVRGLTRFEVNINTGRQEVLNPEGINALRFFEGRGSRVWGARTLSSDPEWKYVNVRRLFIYLEHSIDKATQWAVFEPNGHRLWANIRATVEDFLLVQWRDGALLGTKPEEAYFVRCDRTTMTQNDLDNGRLICLIGVAPVKPAEFVIFRIGQWTADAKV